MLPGRLMRSSNWLCQNSPLGVSPSTSMATRLKRFSTPGVEGVKDGRQGEDFVGCRRRFPASGQERVVGVEEALELLQVGGNLFAHPSSPW